jgi:hypothetical protein
LVDDAEARGCRGRRPRAGSLGNRHRATRNGQGPRPC